MSRASTLAKAVGPNGDIAVSGNTTIGDASTDTVTFNAATASIPNNINFTNGNIGVGVSSPTYKLQVYGGNGLQVTRTAGTTLADFSSTASTTPNITITPSNATYSPYIGGATNDLTFGTNNTERARIDSNGHVLVGGNTVANTPGWDKLVQISASNYPAISLKSSFRQWDLTSYGSSGALIFYDSTAAAERARFNSSGYLGVGVTSPAYLIDVGATSTSNTLNINGTASVVRLGGSSFGQMVSTTALYLDSGSGQPVVFRPNNSSEAGRFDSSGRFLVNTNYTPSSYPAKGTSVSGDMLYSHTASWGGSTKVVTFSGDFNYFCELTVTVWGNGSSGIYQGKLIAGRRDWTGANHMSNYVDQIGTYLDCSVSTSDSSNTRTYTVTFSNGADGANNHWSVEAKVRNLLSFSIA